MLYQTRIFPDKSFVRVSEHPDLSISSIQAGAEFVGDIKIPANETIGVNVKITYQIPLNNGLVEYVGEVYSETYGVKNYEKFTKDDFFPIAEKTLKESLFHFISRGKEALISSNIDIDALIPEFPNEIVFRRMVEGLMATVYFR